MFTWGDKVLVKIIKSERTDDQDARVVEAFM